MAHIRNRIMLGVAGLALVACKNDSGFTALPPDNGGDLVLVEGRVCDPDRGTWLEGATVYMHLFDDQGAHYNTIQDESDADGNYQLVDVPIERLGPVYVQYGSQVIDQFQIEAPVGASIIQVPEPDCGGGDAAMAVVTGDYDEFDILLQDMGFGSFDLINGQTGEELVQFLTSEAAITSYDVIFFGGGHLEEDVFYDVDGSDVDGDVVAVNESLKAYVEAGGTIVATDWSYDVIESIWPEKVEFLGDDLVPDAAQSGETGMVEATVSNPDMAADAGDSVNVLFDLIEWPVIEGVGDGVRVYVRGDVTYREGQDTLSLSDKPILVGFDAGAGTVWLSTFRFQANTDTSSKTVVRSVLNSL